MALIVGGLGNQTLVGVDGEPNDIVGDDLTLAGHGAQGGDDTLIGGANSFNQLYGDAHSMIGPANGGNDTLIGGEGGTNELIGDAESSSGPVEGGNDRLVSAANTTDNMWGDFKSSGGPGTGGQDTFVFAQHNGDDIIHDFSRAEGDIIEIHLHAPTQAAEHIPPQAAAHLPPQAVGSFSDLDITEENGNSIIHFGPNDSVTVLNVTGLMASDFHFLI